MAHRLARLRRGVESASVQQDTPSPASGRRAFGPVDTLTKALYQHQPQDRNYLLLLRYCVVNIVGAALLGAAYLQGWVETVIAGDATHLVVVIFGLFVAGSTICTSKVVWTSRELNRVKSFDPLVPSRVGQYLMSVGGRTDQSRAISATALRLKLFSRIAAVRRMANFLVFLGLIGTVLGFIIALSGVEPEAAADINSVTPMVETMIEGLSVALYTTLVGAVFNIWLMINYQILATSTVNLVTSITELGEEHAGA